MNQDEKLELLKQILLNDEKVYTRTIGEKIAFLEETLSERSKLHEKIGPIIKEELEAYTVSMPEQLGPVITDTLRIQIAESRDEVVEALFPILGQMIKKYIAHEIKILSENIEAKTKNAFSFLSFKRKVRSVITGVGENEIIISELAQAKIDQVFVIDIKSGILMGSYVDKETMDEDMMSGMLTAIKGFVEDAFQEKNQKLTSITYDLYEIHLYNSHNYYIASAINGILTEKLESEIDDLAIKISTIINKRKITKKEELDQVLHSIYSQKPLKR